MIIHEPMTWPILRRAFVFSGKQNYCKVRMPIEENNSLLASAAYPSVGEVRDWWAVPDSDR